MNDRSKQDVEVIETVQVWFDQCSLCILDVYTFSRSERSCERRM